MPAIWLHVALGCYGIGLLYALVALTRSAGLLSKFALHAAYLGMLFQFVSLTESGRATGMLAFTTARGVESLLAFVVMAAFMVVYGIYGTTSPGIIVFPLVFLLTFLAAAGQHRFFLPSPDANRAWLLAHIAFIVAGYAALVLSFGASLLYLLQERSLKAKAGGRLLGRLPALGVIDQIGFRSLLIGFPFMTAGLVVGLGLAQETYGSINFFDPRIFLSLLTWIVYLLLLYTRWNAGWRGRRAAWLASGAFLAAVIAWAANTLYRFGAS